MGITALGCSLIALATGIAARGVIANGCWSARDETDVGYWRSCWCDRCRIISDYGIAICEI